RDLSRLIPGRCPCGCILPRHDQILGRTDDMIIFRAVNIYPGQLDAVLSDVDRIGSEFQIVLERDRGRDSMLIRVERELGQDSECDPELAQTIAGKIKNQLLVTPEVELVDYGTLVRSTRKTNRVIDRRED
ncbi:MAG: phenylacetate--CoA ligase family protein, partial [Thermodesulfobacteriota bacterium]